MICRLGRFPCRWGGGRHRLGLGDLVVGLVRSGGDRCGSL